MLTINISELLLTVLSFFILMFLLIKLAYKPVVSSREQRQKRMDDCYQQERLAKEKLAQTQKELDGRRTDSLKQAETILAQAKAQAQQEAEATAKQAEIQAEEKMQQAEKEAQELRRAGSKALEEQRRQLAADLADRLCH